MMLGKLPAKVDPRTIPLSACFKKEQFILPMEFNFDKDHPGIPTPMFANDRYGCCVIASRAHHTLRLERVEQGHTLRIRDIEVTDAYFRESDGRDGGLVMLNSLRSWRKGWPVGGRVYSIDAFGALIPTREQSIKAAIFLLHGIQAGLWLPKSAERQLGDVWTVTQGRDGERGSWGGHAVYFFAYNPEELLCVTWGKVQRVTWEFFRAYCDEAYGVVDSLDRWIDAPGIDVQKMRDYLREAQNQ